MNLSLITAIYTTSNVQIDIKEIRTFQVQSITFSQNNSDLNLALLYSIPSFDLLSSRVLSSLFSSPT